MWLLTLRWHDSAQMASTTLYRYTSFVGSSMLTAVAIIDTLRTTSQLTSEPYSPIRLHKPPLPPPRSGSVLDEPLDQP